LKVSKNNKICGKKSINDKLYPEFESNEKIIEVLFWLFDCPIVD
jgi:hypothetical protein